MPRGAGGGKISGRLRMEAAAATAMSWLMAMKSGAGMPRTGGIMACGCNAPWGIVGCCCTVGREGAELGVRINGG